MGWLTSRQQELQNCQNQLTAAEADAERIRGELADLEGFRDCLSRARENIRTHRTTVREFVNTDFFNWRGHTHSRRYLGIAQDRLIDRDYKAVLDGIQTTLDNINTRRTVLDNSLLDTNNAIHRLRIRINTLWTEIQNHLNWN